MHKLHLKAHFRDAFFLCGKTNLRAKLSHVKMCSFRFIFSCKSKSFAYEVFCTETRFKIKAKGKSEINRMHNSQYRLQKESAQISYPLVPQLLFLALLNFKILIMLTNTFSVQIPVFFQELRYIYSTTTVAGEHCGVPKSNSIER